MQFTEEEAAEVKKWVVKKLEDMYVLSRPVLSGLRFADSYHYPGPDTIAPAPVFPHWGISFIMCFV